MKRKFLWSLTVSFLMIPAFGEVVFPEAKEIPERLKMPLHAKLSVDADGNLLVNGKIRYLIGVKMVSGSPYKDLQPRGGYPESLKWLYEVPMNREAMYRLGFDLISVNGCPSWLKEIDPKRNFDWSGIELYYRTGLPVHLDVGGFAPWEAGMARLSPYREKLPPEAINPFEGRHGTHWVPYSVFHPAGRELYRKHWKRSLEFARKNGADVFRMELFNEPSYNDPESRYNRELFARYLGKKYGTVGKMNANWNSSFATFEEAADFQRENACPGLYVDWSKFMEDGFVDLCREGAELVRSISPGTLPCLQSRGSNYFRTLPDTKMNLWKISRFMGAISVPTGDCASVADGMEAPSHVIRTVPSLNAQMTMMQAAFHRALADGKPLHGDEFYLGRGSYGLYQGMMRGLSNVSVFEWGKRAWQWRTPQQGRQVAERLSWQILNPYALPAERFLDIMKAKREIASVEEIFVPRNRNVERPVAVLVSYPTERFSGVTGNLSSSYMNSVAGALTFSHFPWDAILEEQLEQKRADRYRVILAPGVKNTYDSTNPILLDWVRRGGSFIALLDTLSDNEYGHRNKTQIFDFKTGKPDSSAIRWEGPRLPEIPGTLRGYNHCSVSGAENWEKIGNVMYRKKLGKGYIYFIGANLQDYSLASVLGGIFAELGIRPECEVRTEGSTELASNIEAVTARRNGMTGIMLLNHDRYPKLLRVAHRDWKAGTRVVSPFDGKALELRKDGSVVLALPALSTLALVSGAPEVVEKQYPGMKVCREAEMRRLFAGLPKPERKKDSVNGYSVRASAMKTLDLRKVANRHFIDRAAGDGTGGWSDQGASTSLLGVPFGIQNFLNVPCDIIRWDMNDERTCIVMDSSSAKAGFGAKEIQGIDVHEKVRAIYFFHTSAWTVPDEKVMSYLLHCKSGKTVELPVIGKKNISDWFFSDKRIAPEVRLAWKNSSGRGFHCWRWENPDPDDEILSISIRSHSGKTIPIVIAITVERAEEEGTTVPFGGGIRSIHGWNGLDAALKDGVIEGRLTQNTNGWCGIRIIGKKKLGELPGFRNAADPILKFEWKLGKDLWGNAGQESRGVQFRLGKGKYAIIRNAKPSRNWEKVRIPLAGKQSEREALNDARDLYLQLIGSPASGLLIRNLEVEF